MLGAVVVGLFVAAALLLAWRSRGWPLFHDAPIFHYIAWRIAAGDVPYRDLFDMNAPGTYLVHLAVLRAGGVSDVAWRAFDLGWLALAALAAGALARPWGVIASVGAAAFIAVYHLAGGAWQAGQRDFLLCPMLLAGAAGVARWAERDDRAALALAGLALGAAMTIKPHVALLIVMLGVVVLVRARRAAAGPLALYAAAAAAAPLAIIAWLASAGALGPWREILLGYLVPVYSTLGRPTHWTVYRPQAWLPIAVGLVLSLACAAWRRALGIRHAVVGLGVLYGVAQYFGQGKGWEYHLYPLAAFAGVLLFAELEPALAPRRRVVGLPLAVCCVAVAVLLEAKGAEAARAAFVTTKVARVRDVVADLGPRLRRDDLVQVLDTAEGGAHALLLLHARQPTRFLYDFPLFARPDAPVTQRYREEFLRDFDARPPRAVVLFTQGWPDGDARRLTGFPSLAERLARDYDAVARRDAYTVYARRHGR